MFVVLKEDIQFAVTQFFRHPKFMLSIMLCLALGMGPNTALFSLINELLFSTVNVEQPHRLVSIGNNDGSEPGLFTRTTSHSDFLYFNERTESFKGMFATSTTSVSLYKDNKSNMITAQMVSSNYFDVLGRTAAMGKTFDVPDEFIVGTQPYVVLSHQMWHDRFQSDKAIVGKSITLNSYDYKVIGVMAPDFTGNIAVMMPDLWVSLTQAPQMRPDAPHMVTSPVNFWLQFYARLNDGVTIDQATQELRQMSDALVEQSEEKSPRSYYATDYETYGMLPKAGLQMMSAALMFIGSLILLLACASLAALLLSRATERRQEMAVRIAMGASRWDLVRQLLIEGLMLSLASGVLALLMTLWVRKYTLAMLPELPISISLSMPINAGVLVYVVCIATLATLLFALAPALQASRFDIMPALKDQPVAGSFEKSTSRLRSFFLVVQFTLSIALLISAGVAIRSMQKSTEVDPGFESKHLVVFNTQLAQYGFFSDEKEQLMQKLKQKFNTIEGIVDVGIARSAPFGFDRSFTSISVFDQAPEVDENGKKIRGKSYGYTRIDQDFFAATNIKVLEGRVFTEQDRDYVVPTVIINQAAAQVMFKGEPALGRYLQLPMSQDAFEVVGIVETIKHGSLGEEDTPFFYIPMAEDFGHGISIIMRTNKDPELIRKDIEAAIIEVEPLVTTDGIKTVAQMVSLIQLPLLLIAWLCGGLGILALILAIVGVYGSVAYSIQLRQQEVGVRLSLGATPNQLIWMLLQKGLLLALVGTVFGIGLAFAITNIMSIVLIGPAQDLASFIGVPLLLLLVTTFGILFPARRTCYREPMSVLRYE